MGYILGPFQLNGEKQNEHHKSYIQLSLSLSVQAAKPSFGSLWAEQLNRTDLTLSVSWTFY